MSLATPEEIPTAETNGVRSVQRAIDILELLNEERTTITVPEIVRETGLAKTTIVRLLRTLDQAGLTWTTPNGITAGPGLWRWAYLARRTWELPAEMREMMRALSLETKETVNLYVIRNVHRVCIAQQQSSQTLRHVVQVGDELPLWAGASSKVLLTEASSDLLDRVAAMSPDGAAFADQLRRSVDTVRDEGYSLSHGERETGVSAVAVPVRSPSGRTTAALSVSGPTSRFDPERVLRFETELRRVSERMTARGFTHPFGQ